MTMNSRLGDIFASLAYYQFKEYRQNLRFYNHFSKYKMIYDHCQRQVLIQFSLLDRIFEMDEINIQFQQYQTLSNLQKLRLVDQSIVIFDTFVNTINLEQLIKKLKIVISNREQLIDAIHFVILNCFYMNMKINFSDFWFSNELVAKVLDYRMFQAEHVQIIQKEILDVFDWDIEIISFHDFNEVFWYGFTQLPCNSQDQQEILEYLGQIGLLIQCYLQFQELDDQMIYLTVKEISVISIIYMVEKFRMDLYQNLLKFFNDHHFDMFFKNKIDCRYPMVSKWLDDYKHQYCLKVMLFKDIDDTSIYEILNNLENSIMCYCEINKRTVQQTSDLISTNEPSHKDSLINRIDTKQIPILKHSSYSSYANDQQYEQLYKQVFSSANLEYLKKCDSQQEDKQDQQVSEFQSGINQFHQMDVKLSYNSSCSNQHNCQCNSSENNIRVLSLFYCDVDGAQLNCKASQGCEDYQRQGLGSTGLNAVYNEQMQKQSGGQEIKGEVVYQQLQQNSVINNKLVLDQYFNQNINYQSNTIQQQSDLIQQQSDLIQQQSNDHQDMVQTFQQNLNLAQKSDHISNESFDQGYESMSESKSLQKIQSTHQGAKQKLIYSIKNIDKTISKKKKKKNK